MVRTIPALAAVVMLLVATACTASVEKQRQADAFRELGLSYLHEGNTPGAIDMLTQARDLNPKDARVHHELGLAYFARELYPEAEASMLRALELDPDLSEARLNLASLYIASGRYEEAATYLRQAIADPLYRRPHRAYNNLGWAYYKTGQLEEAERAYKKALSLAPGFCQAHFNLAVLKDETGDVVAATRHYGKAVELCPRDARFLLEYAAILVRQGRDDEALPYLERVSEADPDGELGDRAREYLQVVQ